MSDEVGNEGRKKCLLYVYDLSGGFAAQMSMALLGKQVRSSAIIEPNYAVSSLSYQSFS